MPAHESSACPDAWRGIIDAPTVQAVFDAH
jgi:hypothetical protein